MSYFWEGVLFVGLIIVLPTAFAAWSLYWVLKSKAPWLRQRLDIGRAASAASRMSFSARGVAIVLSLSWPFLAIQAAFPGVELAIGWWILIIGVGVLLLRDLKVSSSDTPDIASHLREAADRAQSAEALIQGLSATLEDTQNEISKLQEIKAELEKSAQASEDDAKAWQALSANTQRAFVDAIERRSQNRKLSRAVQFVVVTVALNLLATLIWSLAGNPGQDVLLQYFNGIRQLLEGAYHNIAGASR